MSISKGGWGKKGQSVVKPQMPGQEWLKRQEEAQKCLFEVTTVLIRQVFFICLLFGCFAYEVLNLSKNIFLGFITKLISTVFVPTLDNVYLKIHHKCLMVQ